MTQTQPAQLTTTTSGMTSGGGTGGTLVIDDIAYPSPNLNQLYAMFFIPAPDWLEVATYQTLVTLNATAEQQLGKIELLPALATSWDVSSDGTTYTFHIRPSVQFSNGDPFNAYQAWAEFYLWYYVQGNSSSFWMGEPIFDTSHINFGPSTLQLINQSGLVNPSSELLTIMSDSSWPAYVKDANTIVYHTSTPIPEDFFLEGPLTSWLGMMFDVTYVMDRGGPGTPGNLNPYFGVNPIPGTGPYKVTNVVQNSFVEFTQWDGYWGRSLSASEIAGNPFIDPGHYQKVVVYYKPTDTARYLDLVSDKAQIAVVTSSNFQLIANQPETYGILKIRVPAQMNWLSLNNLKFPTNITLVRRAISHAINYTAVIQAAALGYGVRVMGPAAPVQSPYYDPGNFTPYQYDPSLAQQELAQAGFPKGAGLPTMTFEVGTVQSYWALPAAEVIQSNLADIGMSVNIQIIPQGVWSTNLGDYPTIVKNADKLPNFRMNDLYGYGPDYMAANDYWTGFVTTFTAWGNYGGYSNPTVDQAVHFMYQSSDVNAVLERLKAAQEQIYNDTPYVWLWANELPLVQGTYAYKLRSISSLYADPNLFGVGDIPMMNTVIPAGSGQATAGQIAPPFLMSISILQSSISVNERLLMQRVLS